ncbi:hypothetical protein JTE90_028199 [Oedothorax gibbosus]|uniref:Uncharacterized protein n=1 Tax=Oedothorax gibbosus TaxID=931172 RepID=A0AAV6TLB7_9ARAC|nr:hypothetical protein JTE90_028199 [Oedothorax gibbosus]
MVTVFSSVDCARLWRGPHHVTGETRVQERCARWRDVVHFGACPGTFCRADLTFCCVAGPEASKAVLFSHDGVLGGTGEGTQSRQPKKWGT